jgi:hypothetical protein
MRPEISLGWGEFGGIGGGGGLPGAVIGGGIGGAIGGAVKPSPPGSEMAFPGNQVDTRIQQDYGEYVSNERLNCREPDDRCKWLKKNKHRYSRAQYKKTEKAWGCRRSRKR